MPLISKPVLSRDSTRLLSETEEFKTDATPRPARPRLLPERTKRAGPRGRPSAMVPRASRPRKEAGRGLLNSETLRRCLTGAPGGPQKPTASTGPSGEQEARAPGAAGAFPPRDSAPRPLAPRPSPLLVLSGFPREVSAIVKSSAEEFSGVFCCYGWLVGSVRNGVAVRHVGASGRLTGKASPRRMLLEHLGGRETGLLGSWCRRGVALPSGSLGLPRGPQLLRFL